MKKINKKKQISFQSHKANKITLLDRGVILFFVLFLAFFIFQTNFVGAADEEEKLEKYQDELEELEKAENKNLTEIEKVNQSISATQAVIQKTNQTIAQYEAEIENKKEVIRTKEETIKFKQDVLAEYLRLFRRNSLELGLITFDFKRDLGDFLREIESFEDFQIKISEALKVIEEEKQSIEKEKEEVESKKGEKEDALETHEEQKQNLEYLENQKQATLSEIKLSIAEVKGKISKLNSKLNAFLGDDFDMDELIEAVTYAEKKTGVRREFIFAMLDKETDLGRFTGGCYYSKGSNPVKKHMKDIDKTAFEVVMDELGYDKNDKKLSCWPGYGYGGAMGIAQFMPSTWTGYKDKVSSRTGNEPANPWRLEDGVIGMALKLAAAGADNKKKEHYAAKVYYCGSSASQYWDNKCEAYADTVISWSKGYDDYFE